MVDLIRFYLVLLMFVVPYLYLRKSSDSVEEKNS